MFEIILYSVLGIFSIITFFASFYQVEQKTNAIIERFGKYIKIAKPGLGVRIPFVDQIAGRLSLKIMELNINIETKTKDNVFVKIITSVQYYILEDKIYDAFYKLTDSQKQITSYVFDVVRSTVPSLELDEVFEKKEDISNAIKSQLQETIGEYGYAIVQAPITDIDPDPSVKQSMNQINAAKRLRLAAEEKGEADKILKVKEAEAEAKAKQLSGEGIANQRKAIANGLKDSVEQLKESIEGASGKDIMSILMMNLYLDTAESMAKGGKNSVIFMPFSPESANGMYQQFLSAMLSAKEL